MKEQLNYAFAFARGEGKAYWFLGSLLEMKATAEDTGGAFGMVELTHPPGFAAPMHTNRNEEEIFYVLEGEATFTVGEKTIMAKQGSFVYTPRGIPHMYKFEGDGPAKILVMVTPAGFEQFFVEASVPAEEFKLPPDTVVPDKNKIMAAAQKYNLEELLE
ncbi:quercetin 2,3-dioxygenase [Planococcus sp. N028]|uniref:Quercetin 2,3-dioxygenase n=1 Tax=Planococcus shixiaomingii TaxID=3058393 RepID=A0ABT8N4A1_9BACL|nr:quercetin 2,3-dioxygenase [Planococcus sp. N028]MDN7242714.1 quercetin 2,3-dioxygenase [Planococcus sp. N028]